MTNRNYPMGTAPAWALKGMALEWAVATAEGLNPYIAKGVVFYDGPFDSIYEARFTTDWGKGGPIIDRVGISLDTLPGKDYSHRRAYKRTSDSYHWRGTSDSDVKGESYLVVAMRCYVHIKLGEDEDISIPEELL